MCDALNPQDNNQLTNFTPRLLATSLVRYTDTHDERCHFNLMVFKLGLLWILSAAQYQHEHVNK